MVMAPYPLPLPPKGPYDKTMVTVLQEANSSDHKHTSTGSEDLITANRERSNFHQTVPTSKERLYVIVVMLASSWIPDCQNNQESQRHTPTHTHKVNPTAQTALPSSSKQKTRTSTICREDNSVSTNKVATTSQYIHIYIDRVKKPMITNNVR